MVLLPKALAKYMLPIAADQVVKHRRTSVSEGFASSFAFAGIAVAIDSGSAADLVQGFAVVEVSSKESETRSSQKNHAHRKLVLAPFQAAAAYSGTLGSSLLHAFT